MSREPHEALTLIWAMDRNRCIGKDGGIPWHFPEDLRYFKRKTLDHVIVMGRRTWESFPNPLPRRTHVVLTRNDDYAAEGAAVFASLDEGLQYARLRDTTPFIIGGAEIYKQALPLATELLVTHIDGEFEGDTFFPEYDETAWREVDAVRGETPELRFARYLRKDL